MQVESLRLINEFFSFVPDILFNPADILGDLFQLLDRLPFGSRSSNPNVTLLFFGIVVIVIDFFLVISGSGNGNCFAFIGESVLVVLS